MKFSYLTFLIVAICKAQEFMAFCDEYLEYNMTYYGKFISHVKLSNTSDIILADQRLLIIDDELNELSSLPIPKKNGSTCEWIFNQSPGLFFVGCQQSGQAPYLIAYKSLNNTHLIQFGDIVQFPTLLENVTNIKGTLNTLFTIEKTKITFFTLIMTLTDWSITTTQNVLDKNYFSTTGIVYFTDLQFEPFKSDNLQCYKLIVADLIMEDIGWIQLSGQIKLESSSSGKFLNVFIHSTTQNSSMLTFTHQNTLNNYQCINATYNSITSTTITHLLYFQSQSWSPYGPLKVSGNVQGLMMRSSLKQSSLMLYNVVLPKSLNQFQSLQATYSPVDQLTSPPQDYSIFYFNTRSRVVHSIENNKLQSCELYNYKMETK